jgi:hypothetical protein
MNKEKISKIIFDIKRIEKFAQYIKNVFKLEDSFSALTYYRTNGDYSLELILNLLFLGFTFRIKSFNQLTTYMSNGYFTPFFPKGTELPCRHTIVRILNQINIGELRNEFYKITEKIYKNKGFGEGIDGYLVCAIDGTGVFTKEHKKCKFCLPIRNKEGKIIRYEHKLLVAMTSGYEGRNMILDFEMWEGENLENKSKSDGELTVAPTIIDRLPNWVDVVSGDALYCNAPYLKKVCRLEDNETLETKNKKPRHAVVRLKDENIRLNFHKEAMKSFETNGIAGEFTVNEKTVTYYDAKEIEMVDSTVDKNAKYKTIKVRVLRFNEKTKNSDGKIETKIIDVVTTDPNMAAETVLKIIHKRWDIENSAFHQMKGECAFEHCFNHDGNSIEAVFLMMFMAFNITRNFLFRRLKRFRKDFYDKKQNIRDTLNHMLSTCFLIGVMIEFMILKVINIKHENIILRI